MERISAGRQAIDFLKLCYSANRSPLLWGRHGVGKSELLQQAAAELGIGFVCRDLSLMEPPDLVGLPKMTGRHTTFLPPKFLPRSGEGILVFEEINRCDRFVRAPCLQLLTARTLNDYRLPANWLPAAAANPADADYEVFDLDPALLSRFIEVDLKPDPSEWLKWAERYGIHRAVLEYRPITSVKGRGGTDLRPPLRKRFLWKHRPELVIYFTDGYGDAPARAPRVPVIWCLVPEGEQPADWGRTIQMNT